MTSAERARALVAEMLAFDGDDADVAAMKAIVSAIDAAVADALAARWVPVGERLPSVEERVLVQCEDGSHEVARLTYDLGYDDDADPPGTLVVWSINSLDGLLLEPESDVAAWQPLPAPWVAP